MRTIRTCDNDSSRRRPLLALVGGILALAATLALPGTVALAATGLDNDPTPSPGPAPTFAITAPLFGNANNTPEGPIGTYVQVKAQAGSGWTPNATISLGVVPESATCGAPGAVPVTTAQPITVGGDQSFAATFQWPQGATQSPTYIICATESGAGSQVGRSSNLFIVLSNNFPAINVAPLSVPLGGKVQVTGTNFLPVSTIKLWLQHPNQTFLQDPGDIITTANLTPGGDGSFSVSVTLPTDRTSGSNVIVATIGDQPEDNGYYPVSASSQPITFIAATPTPSATTTPIVTPTATKGGGSTSTNTGGGGTDKLLIGLLGLIAVVLLLAGVIVAVLALRGRNTPPADAPTPNRPPSGGFGGYGGYIGDGPLDQTVADADWQGRNWDEDDRWQSPPGRPWSGGRASSPYASPPPPSRGGLDDEDDDRFRTRMGDPYQSAPPPPSSRPNYPPQSRPMGPPQSRPMPPRSNPRPANPNWGGNDSEQDTGPAPWPPRQ